jgi:hypothetical protein
VIYFRRNEAAFSGTQNCFQDIQISHCCCHFRVPRFTSSLATYEF